ncbi:hypothetical protein HY448_01455 [Candidatus Pacearchaeota archaeon]|nr:hypothetical protein [Candidatus Pacearchaeota archaeon]
MNKIIFGKKEAQEQKLKILASMPRKAQEEMVGFALIIIVVSVILLFFLVFTVKNSERESVESYEVESFIQSSLQYTTQCRDNLEFLSVQDVIYECLNNNLCLNGQDACDVLGTTLEEITENSWSISSNSAVKGYELMIKENNESLIPSISKGNKTSNSRGSAQYLPKNIGITFTAYY